MNGAKPNGGPQQAMLNALRQMEQAVRTGQIAHITVIGLQANGAHALVSTGHPNVVSDQAVVGALELAKATIVKQVIAAQERPQSRILPARPVDPANKLKMQ